jgi:hypothetical protein
MTYRIFVSHAGTDEHLAVAVVEAVGSAFAGYVELFLATRKLRAGAFWKEELRSRLAESDAIISIITPGSIEKPWLYIEWAPFWVSRKPWYLLRSSDIDTSTLVSPMSDAQAMEILKEDHVVRFFQALREDARIPDSHPTSPDLAADFLAAAATAMQADLGASFEQHADAAVELPSDTKESRKILEYFYARGDPDAFKAVFRRVDDNALKADVALWVGKKGDLTTAESLCEEIKAADHLCRVASGLIRAGYADARELRHVLKLIHVLNAAELRKLAIEVLDRGEVDAEVFHYMVRIMTNMAELRKVGMRLVEKEEHGTEIFSEIVDKISQTNRTALRDVGLEFLRQGTQQSPEFQRILDILVTGKASLAIPILEELERTDPDMLPTLLTHYRGSVTLPNAALEWLMNKVGGEAPG